MRLSALPPARLCSTKIAPLGAISSTRRSPRYVCTMSTATWRFDGAVPGRVDVIGLLTVLLSAMAKSVSLRERLAGRAVVVVVVGGAVVVVVAVRRRGRRGAWSASSW